jgi:hypothetical protein
MGRVEYLNGPAAPKPSSLVPASGVLAVDNDGRLLLQRRRDTGQWGVTSQDAGRVTRGPQGSGRRVRAAGFGPQGSGRRPATRGCASPRPRPSSSGKPHHGRSTVPRRSTRHARPSS